MNLRSVYFDDDEQPSSYTVQLTADEAAVLALLTGTIAPKTVTEHTGDVRWGNATYDVAEGFAGMFNMHYEGGRHDVLPSRRGMQLRWVEVGGTDGR